MAEKETGRRPGPVQQARDGGLIGTSVRRAVRSDATAFSYSVLLTATFGMVDLHVGSPTVLRLFAFVLGSTTAFAIVEVIASAGFRIKIHEERSDVVMVGAALAPLSVSAGLAVAFGGVLVVSGTWAWAAVPFAATVTYVVMAGLQLAAAHRHEEQNPPEDSE